MKLHSATILITGGAGGIGRAIASELLNQGSAVMLLDRDSAALQRASDGLKQHGDRVATTVADLSDPQQRMVVTNRARNWRGGINVLINNAGLNHFGMFEDQTPEQIDAAVTVNVLAPIHLCRLFLPQLRHEPEAHIVNIGSVFGAIGFPGYVTYSATKFALRGFTEGLRRELADTTIHVHYLAPRATRTPINSTAVERMNAELKVAVDPPERVAHEVRVLLERDRAHAVIGWPEKLFVRVNALLPRVVDRAIHGQLPTIKRYARGAPSPQANDELNRSMT
jgi:short-subunit dehydrogenase